MWKPGSTAVVLVLLSASGAQAQLLEVRQTIFGMD